MKPLHVLLALSILVACVMVCTSGKFASKIGSWCHKSEEQKDLHHRHVHAQLGLSHWHGPPYHVWRSLCVQNWVFWCWVMPEGWGVPERMGP